MSEMMQLPLDVALSDHSRFDNFYPHNHQHIITSLQAFLERPDETVLYLWGERGVGKSHLLQATREQAQAQGRSVLMLDGRSPQCAASSLMSTIEDGSFLCIDNLDNLLQTTAWQEAVFHVFNAMKASQGQVLVASQVSPRQLGIQLEDLRSRLAWGAVYQVHSLSDQDKVRVLQFRADLRGLKLTEDVATYLLNRMPRNMKDLFQVLVALDEASMAAQRAITIPFVKSVFKMIGTDVV